MFLFDRGFTSPLFCSQLPCSSSISGPHSLCSSANGTSRLKRLANSFVFKRLSTECPATPNKTPTRNHITLIPQYATMRQPFVPTQHRPAQKRHHQVPPRQPDVINKASRSATLSHRFQLKLALRSLGQFQTTLFGEGTHRHFSRRHNAGWEVKTNTS